MQQGIQQGMQQGMQQGIFEALTLRLQSDAALRFKPMLEQIDDPQRLAALLRAAMLAKTRPKTSSRFWKKPTRKWHSLFQEIGNRAVDIASFGYRCGNLVYKFDPVLKSISEETMYELDIIRHLTEKAAAEAAAEARQQGMQQGIFEALTLRLQSDAALRFKPMHWSR